MYSSLATRPAFAHQASNLLRSKSLCSRFTKWTCTASISGQGDLFDHSQARSITSRPNFRPRSTQRRAYPDRSSDRRDTRHDRRPRTNYRREEESRSEAYQKQEDEEPSEIQQALASEDDLLYGINPVLLALRSGQRAHFEVLYIQDKAAGERKKENEIAVTEMLKWASQRQVPVKRLDKGSLNTLARNRPHQGVVLRAAPLEMDELKVLPRAEEGEKPVWLVLDEVTDPQNAGALIRSAHFLGARGVALCRKNSTRITATVSKASAGAAEVFDVRMVGSLPRFLKRARDEGWFVIGMAGEGGREIAEVKVEGPTIVVLGSEGFGLRTLVRENCDELVKIDGGGDGVDSLNVSVAGGVTLYELLRR